MNKLIDFDSIDHPDNETVIRITAALLRQMKEQLAQKERNILNDNILRKYRLGKFKINR